MIPKQHRIYITSNFDVMEKEIRSLPINTKKFRLLIYLLNMSDNYFHTFKFIMLIHIHVDRIAIQSGSVQANYHSR